MATGGVLLRIGLLGVGTLALLTAAAALLLPAECLVYLWLGAIGGLLATLLGSVILLRAAALPGGNAESGQAFLRALILDFGLQLLIGVVGILVLFGLNVKFHGFATFGVTFAAAALVLHVINAMVVSRLLQQRSADKQEGGLPEGTLDVAEDPTR